MKFNAIRSLYLGLKRYTTAFLPPDHPILSDLQERTRLQVVMVFAGVLGLFLCVRGSLIIADTLVVGLLNLFLASLFLGGAGVIIIFRAQYYRIVAFILVVLSLFTILMTSYFSRVFPPAGLPFAAAIVIALHFLFNRWFSLAGLVLQTLMFLPFLASPDVQYTSQQERAFWQTRYYANALVSLFIAWLLCESYRTLRDRVEHRLTRMKTDLAMDVELAARIQEDLLPPARLNTEPYAWHGKMRSVAPVGGDYYDAIEHRGHTWIALGDVSGHGLQAGLLVMLVRTTLHQLIRDQQALDPGRVLAHLNFSFWRILENLTQRSFMTFVLLRLDPGGRACYAGCHLKILVYRPAADAIDLHTTRGSWLGIDSPDRRVPFEEFTFHTEVGDYILLYTDGLTETADASGRRTGLDGLLEAFSHALRKYPEDLSRLGEEIMHEYLRLLGRTTFDDDATVVVVRRTA